MAITRTAKGTITGSSNTLTIPTFSITSGASLIVGISYRDQNLRPSSVVWNGLNLSEDARSYNPGSSGGNGHLGALWSVHGITAGGSSTCVITWTGSTPGHQAAYATEVTEISRVDRVVDDIEDGTAAPSSGNTLLPRKDASFYIGHITSAGPVSDTAGTAQNSYTSGQRVGTASGSPPGVVTAHEIFKIVTTAEITTAEKTGATSRDHSSICATYRDFTSVVTSDLTEISDAESTSGWAGGSGSPVLDTASQLEGAGCVKMKFAPGTRNSMVYTISSTDITDDVIYWWVSFSAQQGVDRLAKKSGGGITVRAESGSNNWSEWYVGGRDTLPGPGWTRIMALTSNTPDLIGSSGAANLAAVTQIGIGGLLELTPPTGDFFVFVDIGHYGVGTLTITGGDTEEPASHDALEAFDNDNFWGLIDVDLDTGSTEVSCKVVVGGTGTENTVWVEKNAIIFLINRDFGDGYYSYLFQAGTGTTDVTFGEKVSGATLSGVLLKGVVDDFALTAIDTDLTSFKLYDTEFNGAAVVSLPPNAANREVDGCAFVGGGEIDPDTCVVINSTMSSSPADSMLLDSIVHKVTDSKFLGCFDALHFTTAGTYTLDGNTFAGNTTDIHFSGTGTLTINAINGANPVTSRVTGGGTVIINNTVSVSVTVLDSTTKFAVAGARVLLESDGTPLSEAIVTITRSGSVATVTHTAHGIPDGEEVIIRGSFQNEYNGLHTITVTGVNTYTYTVTGTPVTPATGVIESSPVMLSGITDGAGNFFRADYNFTTDQAVKGWVRRGTAAPRYNTSSLSGTITTNGFDVSVELVSDD